MGEPLEIDLREQRAAARRLVGVAAQHEHAKAATLEQPRLADAEPAIDLELVEQRRAHDHLERELGDLPVGAAAVALVGFEPALLLLAPQRGRAVAVERDAA